MLLLTPPMTTSSSGPHSKSSGRSALHSSPSGRAGGGVSTLFRSSPGDGGALKKAAVVAKRTGSQLAIIRGLIAPPPAGRACSGVMRPNMDRESRALLALESVLVQVAWSRVASPKPAVKLLSKFPGLLGPSDEPRERAWRSSDTTTTVSSTRGARSSRSTDRLKAQHSGIRRKEQSRQPQPSRQPLLPSRAVATPRAHGTCSPSTSSAVPASRLHVRRHALASTSSGTSAQTCGFTTTR